MQAVLLGLYENGVAHTLVAVPPLSVLLNSGILMPAAKCTGRPWLLDSERTLVEARFSDVDAGTRRALGRVFGQGAMHRIDAP
ncbi:MAG: hypothetical protein P8R42_07490 [Candidatus Binatia bacterium]|nr:hypothetical protein [Candidatus Binatia bacterium]